MPSMESLAPLVDRLREIADEEVPHPQTLKIRVWDDGDYQIHIFHHGPQGREQIMYTSGMENPIWQRLKGPSERHVEAPDGNDDILEMEYDERKERQIELNNPLDD